MTIDEDVAEQLKCLGRARDVGLNDLVNEALRRGLREMNAKPQKLAIVRTRTCSMGRPLISIDNVTEALAHLESESAK
ncbi:MAG: hypothetical protein JO000_15610 [Alphaproteobacteria bacterium]|nr:hypothetical protein [Alphaproteobacteria bacterium]